MREQKSSYRWLVGGVLAMALLAFSFSQQDKIRELTDENIELASKVGNLETLLATETTANEQLRAENESYQLENQLLRDTIQLLQGKVADLQGKLKKHKSMLKGIREELALKDAELAGLKAKIRVLEDKYGELAESKKREYQERLEDVEQQREQLKELQKDETEQEESTENQLIEQEMELRRKAKIKAVTESTKVNYRAVECKKTRTSDPLKKLKEDGSDWVYTEIAFDLDNEDQALLADEYFTLKIVDSNSGEELPYLERNPAYTENSGETKGHNFQWRNNPVKLVYINMQAKTGANYDLKIYFLNDDKGHLLADSVRPLIRDGKVVE